MPLAHAILASLIRHARTGYGLAKSFDRSLGYFWNATHQQIYHELARLEAQDLIISEIVEQEGRPTQKLYSATSLGREVLAEWIAQPTEPSPLREDLLVKVFAGGLVPRSVLLEELKRYRILHLEKLTFYQEMKQHDFSQMNGFDLDATLRYLPLSRGIRYEAEWIAWCDEAIHLLDKEMS